ncbi:MAG: STAS domain-containing protein [Cyanobacteria bacterium P01_E01_bin.6]
MLNVFQPSQFVTEVNAQEIRDWVRQSLASGARDLLIDFRDVQFINSSGLGALAIALKMVRENGCRLALCALNPQAQMTLEISGMYKAFEVYGDQDEFVAKAPFPAMQQIA